MDQAIELKHLRSRVFETVTDACVAGTTDMYQEAQAFSDKLCTLMMASGPDALLFVLESLGRELDRGEFSGGSDEDGFNPEASKETVGELVAQIKALSA
jgi:hypothetical protein